MSLNLLTIEITVRTAVRAQLVRLVAAISAVTPDFIALDTDARRKALSNVADATVTQAINVHVAAGVSPAAPSIVAVDIIVAKVLFAKASIIV